MFRVRFCGKDGVTESKIFLDDGSMSAAWPQANLQLEEIHGNLSFDSMNAAENRMRHVDVPKPPQDPRCRGSFPEWKAKLTAITFALIESKVKVSVQ